MGTDCSHAAAGEKWLVVRWIGEKITEWLSSLPVSKLHSNMLEAQDRKRESSSWSGTPEAEGE